jgi:hypothetical protein
MTNRVPSNAAAASSSLGWGNDSSWRCSTRPENIGGVGLPTGAEVGREALATVVGPLDGTLAAGGPHPTSNTASQAPLESRPIVKAGSAESRTFVKSTFWSRPTNASRHDDLNAVSESVDAEISPIDR